MKKDYRAPKMKVVELKRKASLLGSSGGYTGPAGCNFEPSANRQA